MKKIVLMIIEELTTGRLHGLKKWLAVLALAASIAAMLIACSTTYKNRISVAHGKDTIEIIYNVQGRLQKK